MKKYDLIKIHHWLLVSTFKSTWFEENIKLQIISLLSWFIYPEFRQSNTLFSVLGKNKIILTTLSVFIGWTLFSFTFGRISVSTDKENSTIVVEKKTFVNNYFSSLNLKDFHPRRRITEYKVFTDFHIENFDNLHKLPDEVFYAMILEIEKNNIPYSIFFRMMDIESGYKFIRNQNSGANGYCQVLPATKSHILRKIGSTKNEKIDNIRIASYHLKVQYDKYRLEGNNKKESWFKSLLDYNGGSHSLAKKVMEHYTEDIL